MSETCRSRWLLPLAFAMLCLPASAGATDPVHVLPGTEVRLVLSETLSSQTAFKGQRFSLTVEQDVMVQGHVAIPRGAQANGLVVRAEPNGSFGKPGVLQLRIESLALDDRLIPLFYSVLSRGKESDTSAVILTAVFGPIGIVRHGKLVLLPARTKLLAYVDQAFDVRPATTPIPDRSAPAPDIAQADIDPATRATQPQPAQTEQPPTYDENTND